MTRAVPTSALMLRDCTTPTMQAIILDPNLPEAHAALGLIESIGEWDLYNAQNSLKRAIQLAPSYIYAHQWYSAVLLKLGKYDEAIREALHVMDEETLARLALRSYERKGRRILPGQAAQHLRRRGFEEDTIERIIRGRTDTEGRDA